MGAQKAIQAAAAKQSAGLLHSRAGALVPWVLSRREQPVESDWLGWDGWVSVPFDNQSDHGRG